MADMLSAMREFRFLEDKRGKGGLSGPEESRWRELKVMLHGSVDLDADPPPAEVATVDPSAWADSGPRTMEPPAPPQYTIDPNTGYAQLYDPAQQAYVWAYFGADGTLYPFPPGFEPQWAADPSYAAYVQQWYASQGYEVPAPPAPAPLAGAEAYQVATTPEPRPYEPAPPPEAPSAPTLQPQAASKPEPPKEEPPMLADDAIEEAPFLDDVSFVEAPPLAESGGKPADASRSETGGWAAVEVGRPEAPVPLAWSAPADAAPIAPPEPVSPQGWIAPPAMASASATPTQITRPSEVAANAVTVLQPEPASTSLAAIQPEPAIAPETEVASAPSTGAPFLLQPDPEVHEVIQPEPVEEVHAIIQPEPVEAATPQPIPLVAPISEPAPLGTAQSPAAREPTHFELAPEAEVARGEHGSNPEPETGSPVVELEIDTDMSADAATAVPVTIDLGPEDEHAPSEPLPSAIAAPPTQAAARPPSGEFDVDLISAPAATAPQSSATPTPASAPLSQPAPPPPRVPEARAPAPVPVAIAPPAPPTFSAPAPLAAEEEIPLAELEEVEPEPLEEIEIDTSDSPAPPPRAPAPAVFSPAPLPAPPPAASKSGKGVVIKGEHRVVVHTIEGLVKRGTLRDADLAAKALQVELQPGESPEELPTSRVKAIFFMLIAGAPRPPQDGRKLRVTFVDGRQVAGFCRTADENEPGFFMVPGDVRTNTARIYIYRAAVRAIVPG